MPTIQHQRDTSIRRMLTAYADFRKKLNALGQQEKTLVNKINKRLDEAKIQAILQKLKQK
jgi:hypothetical protein